MPTSRHNATVCPVRQRRRTPWKADAGDSARQTNRGERHREPARINGKPLRGRHQQNCRRNSKRQEPETVMARTAKVLSPYE